MKTNLPQAIKKIRNIAYNTHLIKERGNGSRAHVHEQTRELEK